MMDQYKIDVLRFSDLLAKYTGISKSKIDSFLVNNPVNNIFEHTAALDVSKSQTNKLEEIRELRNLYSTLKMASESSYIIDSTYKAGEYFTHYFNGIKDKERFVCSFLNSQNKIIATKVLSEGTVNTASVFPREVVKAALVYDASAVIFSHNHPGGSIQPSADDINMTQSLQKALNTVNIKVLDHIIVADDRYCSLIEKGHMFVLENAAPYESVHSYETVMEDKGEYSMVNQEELINKMEAIIGEANLKNIGITDKERKVILEKEISNVSKGDYSNIKQEFLARSEKNLSRLGLSDEVVNLAQIEIKKFFDNINEFSQMEKSTLVSKKTYSMINRENLLKKIEATMEPYEEGPFSNDLKVFYKDKYEGQLSYNKDGKFVLIHDFHDPRHEQYDFNENSRMVFDSPTKAADYIIDELEARSVSNIKELFPERTDNSQATLDDRFTGIRISGVGERGKYDIEIKFDGVSPFNKGYSTPFVDNDIHPKGNTIASFYSNGELVNVTRHDKNALVDILTTLHNKGLHLRINNPEYLRKEIKAEYDRIKEVIAQDKSYTKYVNEETGRLQMGENALKDYEKYSAYLDCRKDLFSKIMRFFNKNERADYESVLSKAVNAKQVMQNTGIVDHETLAKDKNVFSEMLQSQADSNDYVKRLNGKMNILSSLLQEMAKSSFKNTTQTFSQQKNINRSKVSNLDLEMEMEM